MIPFLKNLLRAVLVIGLVIGVAAFANSKLEPVVRFVEVPVDPDDAPLDHIIEEAAERHELPPDLLRAVARQESSSGKYLYRFEPRVFARVKGPEQERRALASSHGVLHVLGTTAREVCDLHWSRLYSPTVGIDCGARVLASCLKRAPSSLPYAQRITRALGCYNGDRVGYPARIKAQLADIVIERWK